MKFALEIRSVRGLVDERRKRGELDLPTLLLGVFGDDADVHASARRRRGRVADVVHLVGGERDEEQLPMRAVDLLQLVRIERRFRRGHVAERHVERGGGAARVARAARRAGRGALVATDAAAD